MNALIKNNTTDLELILNAIKNLSQDSNSEIETEIWTFTLEDGSAVEKEMVKYYTISYNLEDTITSSNTSTKIRNRNTYETTLSTDSNWETFSITMNDELISDDWHDWRIDDSGTSCDLNIIIKNVIGDIVISVTTTHEGTEEW